MPKPAKKKRRVTKKKVSAKVRRVAPSKKKTPAIKRTKPLKAKAKIPTKVKKAFKREVLRKLLKMKQDILAEVSEKVKSESDTHKFEIGDIYDIASNERDRELSLMLGDRDREKLAEIDEAIERIKNGSYGICEECGEPVAEARLMAMPSTRVCIECKSRDERERGARRKYEEEPTLAILEKTEVEDEEF